MNIYLSLYMCVYVCLCQLCLWIINICCFFFKYLIDFVSTPVHRSGGKTGQFITDKTKHWCMNQLSLETGNLLRLAERSVFFLPLLFIGRFGIKFCSSISWHLSAVKIPSTITRYRGLHPVKLLSNHNSSNTKHLSHLFCVSRYRSNQKRLSYSGPSRLKRFSFASFTFGTSWRTLRIISAHWHLINRLRLCKYGFGIFHATSA